MDRRRLNHILPVALAGTLLALSAVPGQSADADTIVIQNFSFAPMSLTVPAGTVVTWKNLDGEPHTVASDQGLFRSGALDHSEAFTFKFHQPGTFRFICSIHPTMMGTIIVK